MNNPLTQEEKEKMEAIYSTFTDEQKEYIDYLKKDLVYHMGYKVMIGFPYKIRKFVHEAKDKKAKAYYKILVARKDSKGKPVYRYKNIIFDDDSVDLEDGTIIMIKNMFETFYDSKWDKFNTLFGLIITDFEVLKVPEEEYEF